MSDPAPKNAPRKPWRFEFRLRTLFLVTALVSAPLGYVMYQRHRCAQQQVVSNMLDLENRSDGSHWIIWEDSITVREGMQKNILGDNRLDQIAMVELTKFYSPVSKRQLYAISHLPNLKHFSMCECEVELLGAQHLASFRMLDSLSLSGCAIGDQELRYVGGLANLTSLSLNRTRIGDPGMIHLGGLPLLKRLDLHQTEVGDAGVKHLSPLMKLEYLDLSDTLVTEKSLDLLSEHKRLDLLALPPDSFSLDSRAEIRKRLPDCDVIFAKN